MLDPLAQAFRVDVAGGYAGIFVTKLDLYFQTKSLRDNGVTVYICELENGYPNTTKILPLSTAYMSAVTISVSDTADISTTFTFEAPVYLTNQREYCFVVKPDGNDPDYKLWIGELGGTDIVTGNQIFTPPLASTLFYSYTYSTWTAVQTQYVKFDLYRANFTSSSGSIILNNRNTDFFRLANTTFANTSIGVRPGDKVYAATNNTPSTVNTDISGVLIYSNLGSGILSITDSTGNFANVSGNTTCIQIHRPVSANSLVANSTTLIVTANLTSIFNITADAIVPRIGQIQPPGSSINYKFSGVSNSYSLDTTNKLIENEIENEFTDYPRVIMSYSNELYNSLGNKSLTLQLDLNSDNSYISPLVDLLRVKSLAISNLIDSTTSNTYNEQNNSGNTASKYISKPIVLAAGQDAEDLKVYISAYRPVGTDIKAYVKFLNGSDYDTILNKSWTLLTNDNDNLKSNPKNPNDILEFTYSVPTVNALPTTAYFNEGGLIQKTGSGAATVSVSNTSPSVVGSSSLFINEFRIGNSIKVGSDIRQVIFISNNEHLTVDSPFSSVMTGENYYLSSNSGLTYTDVNGITYISFKTFAIKLVLLADSTSLIPRILDVRAIALQI